MSVVNKQELTDHLKQISHLFSKAKEPWRARAFSKVAGELEALHGTVEVFDGTLLTDIDGVGDAIRDVIVEFATTGTSRKLEKLKEKLPNEVYERFDTKTAKRKVTELLKPLTEAGVDWGFAGSARRGSKTVKDVDVIVVLTEGEPERELVIKTIADAGLEADVRNGKQKVGVSIPVVSQGRSVTLDLNFTTAESRGAMYLYFTGPKAFNIKQRADEKAKGNTLNQYGLFDQDGNKLAGETEEDMFEAMGLDFVKPGERA